MTFTAITITPDGNTTCRTWTITEEVRTLEHLQHAVGGPVAVVALGPGVDMWIADEGAINGSGYNPVATAIAVTYGHGHRRYFGTAVLTGGPDPTGATLALTPEDLTHLLDVVHHILATYTGRPVASVQARASA